MKTPLEQAIRVLEELQADTEIRGKSLNNIVEPLLIFRDGKLQYVLEALYDVRNAIESETTLGATRVESNELINISRSL
ncbi:hypothetical protein HFE03_03645 [Paenibacillus sp. EKM102P]|uniref:hypothetical protein n=1 Tax=unclassified Paenibacillus TaxID=185978 RepID=UPI00142E6AC3|nr:MULTISPECIES: hypothetical protein [unclassified Paenibacillus]KAF6618303.1 hypothetical protein HFE00_09480 [Paenibacillus sp. EKM101P]KAF6624649.1 hypothetical protein HFE03_03645 [Paenibacillus sp. EKM102P]KAF6635572.1 hypothetical protein HFE01_01385 [Paenibacillus sp. EKM10P]KAF6648718.1 hypothetical protein HFE02_10165 [Paenibacillus sp. EKM11P]